jgi:hypothetical protein
MIGTRGPLRIRCVLTSLKLDIVHDGLHARDLLGDFHSFVDIGLGVDEATQLNDTLEGFNFNFKGFKGGFVKNSGLNFGSDDGVVKILSGSFLLICRCASEKGCHQNSKENSGKLVVEFHG